MTFPDFLSKASSLFRKISAACPEHGEQNHQCRGSGIGLLEQSHVFHLGEDEDFNASLKEIDAELIGEMKDKVPMPFKDLTTVSLVRKQMQPQTLSIMKRYTEKIAAKEAVDKVHGDLVKETGAPVWVLDRLIEIDKTHPAAKEIVDSPGDPIPEDVQWFLLVRFHGATGMETRPLLWCFGYGGLKDERTTWIITRQKDGIFATEMSEALRYVTSISHPANYIVSVRPKMTQHEERRAAAGKQVDGAKLPHFIVVDHDVVVGMRRDPEGTHSSPVPHERRGHWRRLAERCKYAKLMGKDKVFVRPTLVGETTWESQKNYYEVIMDFRKE
jgi:hypothetical protein